jgi:hypothetical protein
MTPPAAIRLDAAFLFFIAIHLLIITDSFFNRTHRAGALSATACLHI